MLRWISRAKTLEPTTRLPGFARETFSKARVVERVLRASVSQYVNVFYKDINLEREKNGNEGDGEAW